MNQQIENKKECIILNQQIEQLENKLIHMTTKIEKLEKELQDKSNKLKKCVTSSYIYTYK